MDLEWLIGLFGGSMLITVVIILASCVFTVGITGAILFFTFRMLKGMGPNRQILQSGTRAQAVIRNVWQTGTYVNYNPQIGMQLEVTPPNGVPYTAQVMAVVPMVNIPQFQPGVSVPVKIHPTDPSKVELDVYGG